MAKAPKRAAPKSVETLVNDEAKRTNIPTAEYEALTGKANQELEIAYKRRNRDLDPQLVWRGKDEQDWSDLVVPVPPLYIQEKVHPKALIDDLLRQTRERKHDEGEAMADLFADFNGIPKGVDKTEFYQHDQNWSNRMILGDSLQVMASLAEREGLRGKVQCIYFDPPYGIKFNSNFQWSTTSRDVKDGNTAHITREPEQVKAFRDTWRDGIHSYLTYLRDRLTVARDLLTESGSVFVQIGDENVHRVRALLDEVFGEANYCCQLLFKKTVGQTSELVASVHDNLLWYARNKASVKFRPGFRPRSDAEDDRAYRLVDRDFRVQAFDDKAPIESDRRFAPGDTTSQTGSVASRFPVEFESRTYQPAGQTRGWTTNADGITRLGRASRLAGVGNTLVFRRYLSDFPVVRLTSVWDDTVQSTFAATKIYVVQTATRVVERCVQMASDPGDLVLDPTCGSGTTAVVSEEWGRRWITIDTSRVALALARARIMGARYPFYLLADSRVGQLKEAERSGKAPPEQATHYDLRQGFVYERVPHVTLKSIANNAEIDAIWDKWHATLEPLRQQINAIVGGIEEEWQMPREAPATWTEWAKVLHASWWTARIDRQREIDASIAAKAEYEYLYDKPYEDNKKVRVAGPFTVESLSPHRVVEADGGGMSGATLSKRTGYASERNFASMIIENLQAAGVQQAAKGDKITFTGIAPWPGELICADGRYQEGSKERRAAIFIGPEFGTVSRPDLVAAAREAAEAEFDVLIACGFNFEARTTEFEKLGRLPVLKARMNADLHMADELRKTDKANLFVVFGEPDIEVQPAEQGRIRVRVKGVDVFDPTTGEIRSDDPDRIACWFIDTDYNEESFFVRHAYFLGANDPYKALKTTLKAEINHEAWESLHSDTSRPFDKPKSWRIAVKVINHLGDEVMKVVRV
ncbi:MAG: site-specific DNA-methyltransferase [Gemmatimonadales bacterium]